MAETKATVDVITAEVRVLSVGSRQVTLSVYNQLDHASPPEVIPFGRVAPKDARGGYVWIVGKHNETGALVRASLPTTGYAISDYLAAAYQPVKKAAENIESWEYKATRERESAAAARDRAEEKLHGNGYWSAEYHDQQAADADAKAAAAETELARLQHATRAAEHRAKAAEHRAEAETAEQQAAEHDREAANADSQAEAWQQEQEKRQGIYDRKREAVADLAASWLDLPLIVLAGLR